MNYSSTFSYPETDPWNASSIESGLPCLTIIRWILRRWILSDLRLGYVPWHTSQRNVSEFLWASRCFCKPSVVVNQRRHIGQRTGLMAGLQVPPLWWNRRLIAFGKSELQREQWYVLLANVVRRALHRFQDMCRRKEHLLAKLLPHFEHILLCCFLLFCGRCSWCSVSFWGILGTGWDEFCATVGCLNLNNKGSDRLWCWGCMWSCRWIS